MYNHLLNGRAKCDIAFYSAFKDAAQDRKIYTWLKAVCFGGLLGLIIQSFIKNEDVSEYLFQTVLFDIAVSLFGTLFEAYQVFAIYTSPHEFLAMAQARGHIVEGELIVDAKRIEDCVSTTVFVAGDNIIEADLDQPTKRAFTRATKRAVSLSIAERFKSTLGGQRFHSLLSVTSLIMSIITLAQQPMNGLYQPFFITYVILIGLSEIVMLIVIIAVLLVPVFCCLFCVYCCCCRAGGAGGEMNVDEKLATMQDIVKVQGNCSICYQNIAQNQTIIVLPCSDKHLFHKQCIQHWTRVKLTCPICRAAIPTRASAPQPNPPLLGAPIYDQ